MTKFRFTTSKILIITIICLLLLFVRLYFSHAANDQSRVIIKPELSEYVVNNVQRIPDLVGVQIISINLQKNTRYVMYSYFKDSNVDKMYSNFFEKSLSDDIPFFTRDNDKVNSYLVKLINHEFTCVPYTSTVMHEYVPAAEKNIKSVCAVAIPPSYGSLTGAIEIYLSKEPENKDVLITISKNISNRLITEINIRP